MSFSIKTMIKATFGLYLCYHTMAICLVLVPRSSELYSQLDPHFRNYLTTTGNRQYWSMFTSRPTVHGHDLSLDITDDTGAKLRTGVLLPELGEYQSDYFRYHTLFHRMQHKSKKRYLHAYACNARKTVEEHSGRKVESIRLRFSNDYIEPLAVIAETGQIAKKKIWYKGSGGWNCSDVH